MPNGRNAKLISQIDPIHQAERTIALTKQTDRPGIEVIDERAPRKSGTLSFAATILARLKSIACSEQCKNIDRIHTTQRSRSLPQTLKFSNVYLPATAN
jgi:hypothetical protein